MILGRWRNYLHSCHGSNEGLKELVKEKGENYIKENFKYSILDIYKSTTEDSVIIRREKSWKKRLLTKKFGNYNRN